MRTDVHPHSIETYRAERARLSTRARLIFEWLRRHGPHTDREVAARMGFPHRSYVQPRISELIDAGWLVEVGKRTCPETGRKVRVVDVAPSPVADLVEQCKLKY